MTRLHKSTPTKCPPGCTKQQRLYSVRREPPSAPSCRQCRLFLLQVLLLLMFLSHTTSAAPLPRNSRSAAARQRKEHLDAADSLREESSSSGSINTNDDDDEASSSSSSSPPPPPTYSVYFDTSKPLGMKLSADLMVQGFHRTGNARMPAETSGWIRVGDSVVGVNDVLTKGKSLNHVATMIASAILPKKLTFQPSSGNRTAEMATVFDGPQGIHGHEGILEIAKEGFPMGSIPFLQAMFGGPMNCRSAPIVVAVPPHGCGAYKNADSVMDSIVLVERGVCSFSDKGLMAQQASALALIVMNDAPGGEIVRMPIDPREAERVDIALPAVMIDSGDAATLKTLLATAKHRKAFEARLVRKGQVCKPWSKATVVGEAQKNPASGSASSGSTVGDPSAPSGEIFVFMPDARAAAASASTLPLTTKAKASSSSSSTSSRNKKKHGDGSGSPPRYQPAIRGAALQEGDVLEGTNAFAAAALAAAAEALGEDETPHVHAAGYYSDSEQGRGEDGLLHATDGNNNNNQDTLDENSISSSSSSSTTSNNNKNNQKRKKQQSGGRKSARTLLEERAQAAVNTGHMEAEDAERYEAARSREEEEDGTLMAVDVGEDGEPLSTSETLTATVSDTSQTASVPPPSFSPSPPPTIASLRSKAKSHFEYISGKASAPMPQGRLRIVSADPPDACGRIKNDQSPTLLATNPTLKVNGSALLVERGGCTFTEKAANAAAAGASLLVLVNNNAGLFAVTATGEGGSDSGIPVVMITKIAGRSIRSTLNEIQETRRQQQKAAANAAVKEDKESTTNDPYEKEQLHNKQPPHDHTHDQHVGTSEAAHVTEYALTLSAIGDSKFVSIWEELTTLMDTAAWPEESTARRKLYLRLSRLHHPDRSSGSSDRFELLAYLYRRANFWHDPSSEPDFVDDYQAPVGGL